MPVAGNDYLEVTIAKDESLSGEIDVQGRIVVAIKMPAAWTSAGLSFTGCEQDGGTHYDVYDDSGDEVTLTADAQQVVVLTGAQADALASLPYLKVRSGTTGTPVTQAAARTLYLICR